MSRLIRCANKHFYDADVHEQCPFCNKSSITDHSKQETSYFATDPIVESDDVRRENPPMGEYREYPGNMEDDEKTVSYSAFPSSDDDVKEICGWAVCLTGKNRGKDYRIVEGRNFVGRNSFNDIIVDDPLVMEQAHCSLVYESRKSQFWIVSTGEAVTYLNGQQLRGQSRLYSGDIVLVGNTKYQIVTFCDENRNWKTIV